MGYNTQYGPWIVRKSIYQPKDTTLLVHREGGSKNFVLKKPYRENLFNFRREVNILRKLDHQNIVKMVDYNLDPANPYFVTQYYSGGSLATADLSKWTFRDRENFFWGIVSAVNYLHKKSIAPGEIKFGNILIDRNKKAILCDFEHAAESQGNISGYLYPFAKIYFQLIAGKNKPVRELAEAFGVK